MLIVKATGSTSLYIAKGDGAWRKKTEGLLPHSVHTRQSWAHASQALCDNNKHLEHKVPLLSRQVVRSTKSNKENNLLEARVQHNSTLQEHKNMFAPLDIALQAGDKIPLPPLQFSG